MKKIIFVLFALFLISCESKEDVKSDIEILQEKRNCIRGEISNYEYTADSLKNAKTTLEEECTRLGYIKSGKTPRYILKLRLEQSHMSLDISEHIKDNMNAVELVVPVDFQYYQSVKVGQRILDEFRSGSFIMSGSIGDWEVTVIDKKVSL